MSLPGKLVDTPHGRLFVHRAGEGPPLVLIHGYLVSHFYFRPVLADLAKRFDVIALDLPAHGESDRTPPAAFKYDLAAHADAVAQAMEALGVARARVWGHSMGGGVAVHLAAQHPARVERLVVESATLYPLPLDFKVRLSLTPGLGPFLFERVFGKRDLRAHFRKAYRDPDTFLTEEFLDYWWERFNRAGARVALYANFRALSALVDNTGVPGRVAAPTLIVWGEEDRIIPLAHGKRLAKQIPGARLEVVPACGHSPHEERPDEALRLIVPFLSGEEAASVAHG